MLFGEDVTDQFTIGLGIIPFGGERPPAEAVEQDLHGVAHQSGRRAQLGRVEDRAVTVNPEVRPERDREHRERDPFRGPRRLKHQIVRRQRRVDDLANPPHAVRIVAAQVLAALGVDPALQRGQSDHHLRMIVLRMQPGEQFIGHADREHPLARPPRKRPRPVEQLGPALHALHRQRRDQVFLRREMLVDRPLGILGRFRQPVHAQTREAVLLQQRPGDVEQQRLALLDLTLFPRQGSHVEDY